MNDNELEQLREGYKTLSDKRNELNNLISLKKRLENTDIIKLYFEVLKEIEGYEDQSIVNANDRTLMDKVIEKMNIKTSNGIYVYFGSYHGPMCHISKYMDIEKHHSSCDIEISFDEREKFEKEHIILRPKNLGECEKLYNETRVIFFETCIVEGQEKAIEKVLKIRDNK